MHETFEHTADLGLRIRAGDLQTLFEEAGVALFSAIVANFDAVRLVEEVSFALEEPETDLLLRDWLAEMLFAFHAKHLLLAEFIVRLLPDGRLEATTRGEPIDLERHEIALEPKAVTYHGLKVEQEGDGWLAEVIVDL